MPLDIDDLCYDITQSMYADDRQTNQQLRAGFAALSALRGEAERLTEALERQRAAVRLEWRDDGRPDGHVLIFHLCLCVDQFETLVLRVEKNFVGKWDVAEFANVEEPCPLVRKFTDETAQDIVTRWALGNIPSVELPPFPGDYNAS